VLAGGAGGGGGCGDSVPTVDVPPVADGAMGVTGGSLPHPAISAHTNASAPTAQMPLLGNEELESFVQSHPHRPCHVIRVTAVPKRTLACIMLNAVFCDVFVMRDAKIRHLTSYLMELPVTGR